jgi:hypothetical protein
MKFVLFILPTVPGTIFVKAVTGVARTILQNIGNAERRDEEPTAVVDHTFRAL